MSTQSFNTVPGSLVVAPREGRTTNPLTIGGQEVFIKVAGADTNDGLSCMVHTVPPMTGPPLHQHQNEDELFYSVDGEHVIEVGEREHRIGPGEMAFGPRGVPHSQRRVVPGEGRLLIITTPAGLEGFFRELAAAETAGTLGPEAYAGASERYGITWL